MADSGEDTDSSLDGCENIQTEHVDTCNKSLITILGLESPINRLTLSGSIQNLCVKKAGKKRNLGEEDTSSLEPYTKRTCVLDKSVSVNDHENVLQPIEPHIPASASQPICHHVVPEKTKKVETPEMPDLIKSARRLHSAPASWMIAASQPYMHVHRVRHYSYPSYEKVTKQTFASRNDCTFLPPMSMKARPSLKKTMSVAGNKPCLMKSVSFAGCENNRAQDDGIGDELSGEDKEHEEEEQKEEGRKLSVSGQKKKDSFARSSGYGSKESKTSMETSMGNEDYEDVFEGTETDFNEPQEEDASPKNAMQNSKAEQLSMSMRKSQSSQDQTASFTIDETVGSDSESASFYLSGDHSPTSLAEPDLPPSQETNLQLMRRLSSELSLGPYNQVVSPPVPNSNPTPAISAIPDFDLLSENGESTQFVSEDDIQPLTEDDIPARELQMEELLRATQIDSICTTKDSFLEKAVPDDPMAKADGRQTDEFDQFIYSLLKEEYDRMITGGCSIDDIEKFMDDYSFSREIQPENSQTVQDESENVAAAAVGMAGGGEQDDQAIEVEVSVTQVLANLLMAAQCGDLSCTESDCQIGQQWLATIEKNLNSLIEADTRSILGEVYKHAEVCSEAYCTMPYCSYFSQQSAFMDEEGGDCVLDRVLNSLQLCYKLNRYCFLSHPQASDRFIQTVPLDDIPGMTDTGPTERRSYTFVNHLSRYDATDNFLAVGFSIPPQNWVLRTMKKSQEEAVVRCRGHPCVTSFVWAMVQEKYLKVALIFEDAGSTMDHYLRAAYPSGLPTELVWHFMRQLLDGVVFLHQRNIVFLAWAGRYISVPSYEARHVKLGDLRYATLVDPSPDPEDMECLALSMPPDIVPPELYEGTLVFPHSESWGIALLMYEMATGRTVYHDYRHDNPETLRNMLRQHPSPQMSELTDADMMMMAAWCLQVDEPGKRLTAQVLQQRLSAMPSPNQQLQGAT